METSIEDNGFEFCIRSHKTGVYNKFLVQLKKSYRPDEMPTPAEHLDGDGNPVWRTTSKELFDTLDSVGYIIEKRMAQDIVYCAHQDKTDRVEKYNNDRYSDYYYFKESGAIVFQRSEIASYLLRKFHALVVVSDKYMYIYNRKLGIYEIDYGDTFITELNTMFGDMIDIKETREIMAKIFNNAINQHNNLEDIWQDNRYINFKNGIYDIEKRKLIEHSPDYYFMSYIPVDYDPDATCPNIEKLMRNVFTDDQLDNEYEWIGYCLTPGNKYKVFSIYIGTTDSGRSTYFNLIEALIGVKNKAAIEPQDLAKEFYLYELHDSMVNICADIGSHKIKNFNVIKKLTGGDPMVANIKNKPLITFRNNCKLMWAANRMPGFDDSTSAAYNRLRQINCCKVIDESDKGEFDFAIYITEDELSGLINLAIEGLHRLNERNKFILPTIDERIDQHEVYAESLFSWAEDSLIFDKNDTGCKVFGKDLYDSYISWCDECGMNISISNTAFIKEYKNAFHKDYNRYYSVTINGERLKGCSGVQLREDIEYEDAGDFYVAD